MMLTLASSKSFISDNSPLYIENAISEKPIKVTASRDNKFPTVVHHDGTARVQTVSRDTTPRFHSLVREFGALSSVPVVLNTSFNTRGEPIIETPLDAIRTFNGTGLDALFIGDFVVSKPIQPRSQNHATQ